MRAYYNEIDFYCCDWLQNLMDAGHITPGRIDERSIVDVSPDDVAGYERVHFFAGIGGWDHALSLCGHVGPVWTGSCPCQPFSAAGKGKSADDERHLWPTWFSLIRKCKPAIVFGEQVEAAIGWGWLDAVFADLEAEGYACGAAVLPACGVGAPHIRQRVWFVAQSSEGGLADAKCGAAELQRYDLASSQNSVATEVGQQRIWDDIGHGKSAGELADATAERLQGRSRQSGNGSGIVWGLPCEGSPDDIMGHASGEGSRQEGRPVGEPSRSFWTDLDWLPCTDGKARPVEPGTFPLAHGIPGRVGRLRAYGNAIVPQLAAEFIIAACK